MISRRHPAALVLGSATLLLACGSPPPDRNADDTARGSAPPSAAAAAAAADAPAAPAGGQWGGAYDVRGSLEGGRSVTGTLSVEPLTPTAPEHAATEQRVRRTYPSYAGPYLRARLIVAERADTVRGTFTCAHGPSAPPPLVCEPTTPMRGLKDATLVVQPDGRAVLTGSHGEGVSVEYGRFSWTRSGA